jgi:hypothetical protein
MIVAECGAVGGMTIGRGNRSTRKKPAPEPLCPYVVEYPTDLILIEQVVLVKVG